MNSSFVLYLLVYLPQIIHNRKPRHISSLSMGMHFILFSSYCLDLLYGFSSQLQWQYKTVSVVGLTLLLIQHLQITKHAQAQKKSLCFHSYLFFILMAGLLVVYFFTIKQAHFSVHTTNIIGYISRAGFLIYTLPQIIKTRSLKSASAVSIQFIYLSLALSLLDMTSAWCLNWGWPNKLGSPVSISLLLIMLFQMKKYHIDNPDEGCMIIHRTVQQ